MCFSVCTIIRAHILEAVNDPQEEGPKAAIFHDYDVSVCCQPYRSSLTTPTSQSKGGLRNDVPSLSELVQFFRDVYTKSQMEMECIIMSLIYMERLTKVESWYACSPSNDT